MSDTRNHTTRDQLAKVVADAICRDRPKYSPDQACRAHQMQAEYAADALLASDAIAAVRAAAVAETTAAIETLPRLRRWIDDSELVDLNDVRAALSGGRTALDTTLAQAWDEGRHARPQYLGPTNGHYEDCMGWNDCHCGTYTNPYRADTGADQ